MEPTIPDHETLSEAQSRREPISLTWTPVDGGDGGVWDGTVLSRRWFVHVTGDTLDEVLRKLAGESR